MSVLLLLTANSNSTANMALTTSHFCNITKRFARKTGNRVRSVRFPGPHSARWVRLGFFKTPYGAPEPHQALGKRPEGVAHREVRDGPTRQEVSWGQRRDPKPRRRGTVRHPGRAFF